MGFRCTAIVGNQNGLVGVGCMAGRDVAVAAKRALVDAKKNIVRVRSSARILMTNILRQVSRLDTELNSSRRSPLSVPTPSPTRSRPSSMLRAASSFPLRMVLESLLEAQSRRFGSSQECRTFWRSALAAAACSTMPGQPLRPCSRSRASMRWPRPGVCPWITFCCPSK